MSETKKITTLYMVTDSENHYDQIGDIDGGLFDEEWLMDYIKSYGHEKLIEKLAWMSHQIIAMRVKINIEMSKKFDVKAKNESH